MFRSRVADFYRARGYEVREGVKVRGASQNVYHLDMVAEGPLGALLVSFGDAAGVDAAEVSRVRTVARDIGATPVVASATASADLRRLAAQLAVVVLEESALDDPAPRLPGPALADPAGKDLAAHPWPASGRAGPVAEPARLMEAEQVVPAAPVPAAWQPEAAPSATQPRPAGTARFAWLDAPAPGPEGPRPPLPPPAPPRPLEHEGTVETRMPPKRISMGRLALYVAGGMFVLYLLSKMLG
ncbi:MAG TPA: hypothetical protein VM286_03125 [Candidatus Thermoplasmatota archaeon]|nr:hypothetical protein [Candidatus Thermoplasmatota archaeon]